jgi:hypothetical protein
MTNITRLGFSALCALLLAACAPLSERAVEPERPLPPEQAALLEDIRGYEWRIGFRATRNFVAYSGKQAAYNVCGYVSRFILPYSYQDPAIHWADVKTRDECLAAAGDADVYFDALEARGESASPVTPAMAASTLARFVYLVVHEDCHDQFALPFGIEEALCNLVAYKAMIVYAGEKYAADAPQAIALRDYGETQGRRDHATVGYYEQVAALYGRYASGTLSADELMRERRAIFASAEAPQGWAPDSLNNVGIANQMTYSRHYPFMESVYDALGHDLLRTIAFFKRVDAIKPSAEDVMKARNIADRESVEYLKAHEGAIIETARRMLAETGQRSKSVIQHNDE